MLLCRYSNIYGMKFEMLYRHEKVLVVDWLKEIKSIYLDWFSPDKMRTMQYLKLTYASIRVFIGFKALDIFFSKNDSHISFGRPPWWVPKYHLFELQIILLISITIHYPPGKHKTDDIHVSSFVFMKNKSQSII